MKSLDTDIQFVRGVGQTRARAMNRLGIFTLEDLIMYFPRDYEDRRIQKHINEAAAGETVCISAVVAETPRLAHIRRGLDIVKLRAYDDTGSISITFFNQAYIKDALKMGETYIFYGKLGGTKQRPELTNPEFEQENSAGRVTMCIVPIYSLTAGISKKLISGAVRQGLDACAGSLPEPVPAYIRNDYKLAAAPFAYESIHFPKNENDLAVARRKLIFEELYVLSCALGKMRSGRTVQKGRALEKRDLSEFSSVLSFELTGAQKRAIAEAFGDMTNGAHPMSRLVQGDVGSGKTVVAAACCWLCARSGAQAAVMAPTEILAVQHYDTLSKMLESFGIHVDILTGGMTAKRKREAVERLTLGETDVIIGTHALLSDNVAFYDLALVVADEQHRFGVMQRAALINKGASPHVLVMSATPIPRTLALIIYKELDISVIDELPPGRQRVDTFAVGEGLRARVYAFIKKHVEMGRQAYVVCHTVEDDEEGRFKSAVTCAQQLQQEIFPELRIGLLHGKMKPKEKERIMEEFSAGEIDILVATTVIEVGVDVPNAVLMVIENADTFGLSQLHQLRGRVGRGQYKSYCILFNSGGAGSSERLEVMCRTNNGFEISEADLKLRGPGDFFGSRQHGLPEMKLAGFMENTDVLGEAQKAAEITLGKDPELTSPEHKELRRRIKNVFDKYSGAIN